MRALFLTSQDLIARYWQDVASLIAEGVEQVADEFTVEDLEKKVASGDAFAGLVFDDDKPVLAMVFRFKQYPRTQAVHVMALGGRSLASAAISFWPQFVAWARESGATRIEACAGPAMTRVLRGLGFAHRHNFLRVEV